MVKGLIKINKNNMARNGASNGMKKVLIATGIFPPDIGGPATYSKLLADALPEKGVSVVVVSFGEVRHLPKVFRHTTYFFKVLWRARECDIIYAQDPVSVGLPAMFAAKILRKKFYLKIVGDYAWEQGVQRFGVTDLLDDFSNRKNYSFPVRVLKYIQTMVAHRATKIVVPSNYLKQIVNNWGIFRRNIVVIYNAFEPLEQFESREVLRKKFGFSGKVITSVGRLVPWKGFEGVITVFAELQKKKSDMRLVIIGDGPELQFLEQHAQKLGVRDAVFFAGRLAQHEMLEYVKASDVFVLNTSYEGFSHQILEVLAVGTPCVTTSAGGNTEIIQDDGNGLLVPYNDLSKLKKTLERIFSEDILSEKIRAGGQRTVLSYGREKMVSELISTLGMSGDSQQLNVLSISSDRKVFEEGSAVRTRLLDYGSLVDNLHVMVFARRSLGFRDETISSNIFLYPTNSLSRFFHIPFAIVRAFALKRRGISIDVVTTQDPFECGLAGFFIAHIFGARIHIQIHTDFMSPHFASESVLNRARVLLAKFLIPRANAIRVVSERIKNSLSTFHFPLSTTTVLPIFIEKQKHTSISKEHDLKKKYPQFDFYALLVARLASEKNIKSAIEAFDSVVKKYPKTGFVIVGSGPEDARLKKLVRRLGLEKNVIFEGWQDDLFSYYKTASVLVFPSLYEGYGMVAVEALCAGCPVIMTDVGCAGDVVRDRENGLVVPAGDTPALAYAMERTVSGSIKLTVKPPKLPTKKEYLATYKKSWEDALR